MISFPEEKSHMFIVENSEIWESKSIFDQKYEQFLISLKTPAESWNHNNSSYKYTHIHVLY